MKGWRECRSCVKYLWQQKIFEILEDKRIMILCWSWFFKGLVDDKGSLYLECWCMPLQLPCVVLDGERSRMNEYVDFPKSILAAMLWKDVL